eukprot:jgi/Mesvir1/9778/Mv12412-RA.1
MSICPISSPPDARPSTPTAGASHPGIGQRSKPPASLAPLGTEIKMSSRPPLLSPVDTNRLSEMSAALLSPARIPLDRVRHVAEPPASSSALLPGMPRMMPPALGELPQGPGRPVSGGSGSTVLRTALPHTLPSLQLPSPVMTSSSSPSPSSLSSRSGNGASVGGASGITPINSGRSMFSRDRLGAGLALTSLASLEIGEEAMRSPTQAREGEAGRRRQKLEVDVRDAGFSPKGIAIAQSPTLLSQRSPFTATTSPLQHHLARLSPLGPGVQGPPPMLASPHDGVAELDTAVERRIQRVSMESSTPKGTSTPKVSLSGFTPRPTSTPTRAFSFGRWRGEPADSHSEKGSPLGSGTRGGRPMAGLANLGNTCFMNTILQCLLSTDALLSYLQGGRTRAEAVNGERKALKIINSVEDLVRDLSRAKPMSSVAPSNFLRQMVTVAPHFEGNEEHDCQEFLTTLLELMNDDLNRAKLIRSSLKLENGAPLLSPSPSLRALSPQLPLAAPGSEDEQGKSLRMWKSYLGECNSIITDLFAGQLCSCVQCTVCQQRHTMYESFLDLSVPIPKGNWITGGFLTDLADWGATSATSYPSYDTVPSLTSATSPAHSNAGDETPRTLDRDGDAMDTLDRDGSISGVGVGYGAGASSGGGGGALRACPLEACLRALTEEEPLDGDNAYMCSTCNRRQRAVKRLTLCRLPRVLVIHIKRFTYSTVARDKLSTLVSFPLRDLSLSEFSSEFGTPDNGEGSSGGRVHRPPASYDLFAVGHHAGSMASGHYFAHCLNQDDKNWYCFNDDAVTPISATSVVFEIGALWGNYGADQISSIVQILGCNQSYSRTLYDFFVMPRRQIALVISGVYVVCIDEHQASTGLDAYVCKGWFGLHAGKSSYKPVDRAALFPPLAHHIVLVTASPDGGRITGKVLLVGRYELWCGQHTFTPGYGNTLHMRSSGGTTNAIPGDSTSPRNPPFRSAVIARHGKAMRLYPMAQYNMSHNDMVQGKVPPSPELEAALQASTAKILVIILHGMQDASVSDRNELKKLMAERGAMTAKGGFLGDVESPGMALVVPPLDRMCKGGICIIRKPSTCRVYIDHSSYRPTTSTLPVIRPPSGLAVTRTVWCASAYCTYLPTYQLPIDPSNEADKPDGYNVQNTIKHDDSWPRSIVAGLERTTFHPHDNFFRALISKKPVCIMGTSSSKLEKVLGDSFPESERYFGLENFGNTCYCNSVLQSLYFCAPFRTRLMEQYAQYTQGLEQGGGTTAGEDGENLLVCLGELFAEISNHKKKTGVIAPRRFISCLKKENELFRSYMHQDAQEFLYFLLNNLVEILQKEAKAKAKQQQRQQQRALDSGGAFSSGAYASGDSSHGANGITSLGSDGEDTQLANGNSNGNGNGSHLHSSHRSGGSVNSDGFNGSVRADGGGAWRLVMGT